MAICYLGIGSNLGNRRKNLEQAVRMVNLLKDTKALKLSSFIETDPIGGPPTQPKFLNASLKISTKLLPLKLLKELKRIEKKLGRLKVVRNGPRIVDLDILLYADKVIKTDELIVPHPRMFARGFVIRTLAQVI
ncbi:MAG: 2-amino-4-hydroxy-6-hydroxymethyldihydropteridine diphosphokinase [Candidatus Omnitrophota bacterium]